MLLLASVGRCPGSPSRVRPESFAPLPLRVSFLLGNPELLAVSLGSPAGLYRSRGTMPSIIYSFVAQKNVVLVDYTTFSGNFSTVAIQCLQKCPETNSRFTYSCDHHTFNFLIEAGFSKFSTIQIIACVCTQVYRVGFSLQGRFDNDSATPLNCRVLSLSCLFPDTQCFHIISPTLLHYVGILSHRIPLLGNLFHVHKNGTVLRLSLGLVNSVFVRRGGGPWTTNSFRFPSTFEGRLH